jgi:hypothetical protein
MSTKLPVDAQNPLCGTWVASSENTDDYGAEYSISVVDGEFCVAGVDRADDEQFDISEIQWDGEWLTFSSFMPSTLRRGHSRMRYLGTGEIEFFFTFTIREIWRRNHEG